MLKRFAIEPEMKTFTTILSGQLVSMFGTAMTRFALLIWLYDQTGDATTLALLGFFSYIPLILVSPLAGMWVDRLDRRKVMLAADTGAALLTAALLTLYAGGGLQVWHLYAAQFMSGVLEAFQYNAFDAALTTLVPKSRIDRANGLNSLSFYVSSVAAPPAAGLLLGLIDVQGVMVVDLLTFLAAFGTLAWVRFPKPLASEAGRAARGDWRHEMSFGFRYIVQRPGLLGITLIMAGISFIATLTYFGVMPAMILARSGGDKLALASVEAALGAGGVVGALLVSARGLPKRRIHGVLATAAVSFLFGDFLFAIGRITPVWMLAGFVSAIFIPYITGSYRAIWQVKVPQDIQGRVFAVRSSMQEVMFALGFLLAGPLADKIFEPAMAVGGSLAGTFGGLVGVGAGAGMGLMFACTSVLGMLISASGYLFSPVRRVEDNLPDYDEITHAQEYAAVAVQQEAVA